MTRLTITLVTAGLLAIAIPETARAQNTAGELSAGWRLVNAEDETIATGWYADVLGNVTSLFGVVGEVSGHYDSIDETETFGGAQVRASGNLRIHTFMGGVRFTVRQNPRLVPFAQALVGLAHASASIDVTTIVNGQPVPSLSAEESESTSDAAVEFGGGVNIRVTSRLGVRVGASYLRILEDDASNAFRAAAGVVFPF